jgi:hypothetical protein
MLKRDIAWRGFVDAEGKIIAWPTLLADHNQFFSTFYIKDDYPARWRQWSAGGEVDFDPGATPQAKDAVEAWLRS